MRIETSEEHYYFYSARKKSKITQDFDGIGSGFKSRYNFFQTVFIGEDAYLLRIDLKNDEAFNYGKRLTTLCEPNGYILTLSDEGEVLFVKYNTDDCTPIKTKIFNPKKWRFDQGYSSQKLYLVGDDDYLYEFTYDYREEKGHLRKFPCDAYSAYSMYPIVNGHTERKNNDGLNEIKTNFSNTLERINNPFRGELYD